MGALYDLNKMHNSVITKEIYKKHLHKQIMCQKSILDYIESTEALIFENIIFGTVTDIDIINDLMFCYIGVKDYQWSFYLEVRAWEIISEYNLLSNVTSWIKSYYNHKNNKDTNEMRMAVMAERILTNISKIVNPQLNRELGYVYIFLYSFMKREYYYNKDLNNHIYSYRTISNMSRSTLGNIKSMIKCSLSSLNPESFVQNYPILGYILFIDIVYNFLKNNPPSQEHPIGFRCLRDWYNNSIDQILGQYV